MPVEAPKVMLPKPWPEFLAEVDARLSGRVDLHCLGGFPLIALYQLPRTTGDLDYLTLVPMQRLHELEQIAGPGSELNQQYGLSIHNAGPTDLPESYSDRLQELPLGSRNLHIWILDPYDLILSKLARNSPKDREDVKYLIGRLDLEFSVFYRRWEAEMKPWIANAERHETTINDVWRTYFRR